MFCSTGKPQDKDPRCLIPARLQNKRESCCFIKTTRHSVCSHPCVCVFFFYFPPPPPPPLMQLCSCCARKMICALFDEVAAKLVKTSVEVRCLKRLYCFILICERFLKCVNQPPALSRALLRPSRWWISLYFLVSSCCVFVFELIARFCWVIKQFNWSSFSVRVGKKKRGGDLVASANGGQAKRHVERGYVCVKATGRWWVGAG